MLISQPSIDVQLHPLDLDKKEHTTADFLALSPGRTIPVLKYDDVILTESRAIMGYLVDRYAVCTDDEAIAISTRQAMEAYRKLLPRGKRCALCPGKRKTRKTATKYCCDCNLAVCPLHFEVYCHNCT